MITKNTASRIWSSYREIEVAEKLLADMKEIRSKERLSENSPTLDDAFGRRTDLQLGIPSGSDGHRLFRVAPQLAESVIRAHIAEKRAELVSANEQARMELESSESIGEL